MFNELLLQQVSIFLLISKKKKKQPQHCKNMAYCCPYTYSKDSVKSKIAVLVAIETKHLAWNRDLVSPLNNVDAYNSTHSA